MAAAAATTTTTGSDGSPAKPVGKRKLLFIGAGAVLLLGGGGAAWFTGVVPHLLHHEEPHAEAKVSTAPVFLDLPDIVANLNAGPRRAAFIKLFLNI